jgi:hypothetical protein
MTFLGMIYPVFTIPYLQLYYFPWVIPIAIVAEVAAFILLDPDASKMRLSLTILTADALCLLAGFVVGFILQFLLQTIFGDEVINWAGDLEQLGLLIAVSVTCLVKCVVWRVSFGPNRYLRRVVIVIHGACFLVLCACFEALPYYGLLHMPELPSFLK